MIVKRNALYDVPENAGRGYWQVVVRFRLDDDSVCAEHDGVRLAGMRCREVVLE